MIENFNPFISLGGKDQKINHMAEAALEMNLTCNDLKKDLDLTDGDVIDMEGTIFLNQRSWYTFCNQS